jgi:endonuclease YncB( thermonuclease family)
MKRESTYISILIALAPLLSSLALASFPRLFSGRARHVAEHDNITALTSEGTKLRLRLLGIDAPEVSH